MEQDRINVNLDDKQMNMRHYMKKEALQPGGEQTASINPHKSKVHIRACLTTAQRQSWWL